MTTAFSKSHLKRLAAALSVGAVLLAGSGAAQANGVFGSIHASAQGSAALFKGSATIIQGSAEILVAGSQLVVESVHYSAEGAVLVLRGASEMARITLQVVGHSVTSAVTAAGTVLRVSATAAGHILHAGGEVVAFVPSTVGRALVHSSYHGDPSNPHYGGNLHRAWISDNGNSDAEEGD